MAELQCSFPIKSLQSDNALKFKRLNPLLESSVIQSVMGVVERGHRHFVDMVIMILIHANMQLKFWDYLLMTTTHVYNQNPSSTLLRLDSTGHYAYVTWKKACLEERS